MNSHDVHHMCTMHQVPRAQMFALGLVRVAGLVTAMPRGLVKKRPAAAISSIVPVQYEPEPWDDSGPQETIPWACPDGPRCEQVLWADHLVNVLVGGGSLPRHVQGGSTQPARCKFGRIALG